MVRLLTYGFTITNRTSLVRELKIRSKAAFVNAFESLSSLTENTTHEFKLLERA